MGRAGGQPARRRSLRDAGDRRRKDLRANEERAVLLREVRFSFKRGAADELQNPKMQKDWRELDLDRDGLMGRRDWQAHRAKRSVQNGLLAYRIDSRKEMRGDLTESHLMWRYQKSLPTPRPPSPAGRFICALEIRSTASVNVSRRISTTTDDFI